MPRELEHLQEATRRLADAERRIAEQRDRIAKLEAGGHHTIESLSLLRMFEQTRDLMIAHRDIILRALGGATERRPLLGSSAMRTKQEVLNSHADRCFRRSALTTNPLTRHEFLDMAAQWLEVAAIQQELEGRSAQTNALASGSKAPSKILTKREAWLSGQRQAFEIAILGGALETTLGILIRTASDVIGGGVRAAFYLANPAGTSLHHVVGMSAAYAEAVDGFKIGADSLACGLATHIGRPILTADVATDPCWAPWRGMAEKFDYRGCWSFPMRTGLRNGSFAIYSRSPREATATDVQFAELVTQTAAILIRRNIHKELR